MLTAVNHHRTRSLRPRAGAAAPFFLLCSELSYWLNNQDGDCETAEECYNIAAAKVAQGLPEYIVTTADLQAFLNRYGLADGTDSQTELAIMRLHGLPTSDGRTFTDGPAVAVDYTNDAAMDAAIATCGGSVKIAIAADQLQAAADDSIAFNFAFGFRPDNNIDHCTGLSGTGTARQCCDALNAMYQRHARRLGSSRTRRGRSLAPVPLPAGVNPSTPCRVMFSWDRYFIIDNQSLKNIQAEAWVRSPSSIDSMTPVPPPKPPPPPAPTPAGVAMVTTHDLPAGTGLIEIGRTIARVSLGGPMSAGHHTVI